MYRTCFLLQEVEKYMRSENERLRLLHRRAAALKRKENERKTVLTGGVSALLLVLLITILAGPGGKTPYTTAAPFAGTSMLSECAGGYVLVAIIAFAAAVVITVLCMKWKRKKRDEE